VLEVDSDADLDRLKDIRDFREIDNGRERLRAIERERARRRRLNALPVGGAGEYWSDIDGEDLWYETQGQRRRYAGLR